MDAKGKIESASAELHDSYGTRLGSAEVFWLHGRTSWLDWVRIGWALWRAVRSQKKAVPRS